MAVDDEPEILELYRKLFTTEAAAELDLLGGEGDAPGAHQIECRTYAEPQKMLEEYSAEVKQGRRCPLCIVDMRMSAPDEGLTTAIALRQIDDDIDIIFCTAVSHIIPEEIRQKLKERVFFVGKPFNNEEFTLLVQSLVDYWQSRQDLHRESAFASSLLESATDLIFAKDTKGVYTRCNSVFARFAKLPHEKVIGITDKEFMPENLASAFMLEDEEVLRTGRALTIRQWVEHPDGSSCQLETIKSPIFSATGECIGILGVGRDVTERDRSASGYMI